MSDRSQAWRQPMPEAQFQFMRDLLAAPSPIGFEGAMTFGVLEPYVKEFAPSGWKLHRFRGNAGLVIDTAPDDSEALSVMVIGHADKIRMQVRHVGDDGKIWINTDSFLPSTLIGHEVQLFSEDPAGPGQYRVIEGGTIEAIGAIHFADAELRSGSRGIKPEMMFLELQIHGDDRREQVERLGIKAGDPILLRRPIRRGFSPNTFYGAYLDNGLGVFLVAEVARLLAERGGLSKVRFLGAAATHEEIGRQGSRVLAQEFRPDVVIGVDVSHDLEAAPGVSDKRFTKIRMGAGFTLSVGAIVLPQLNALIQDAARELEIPFQLVGVGRDTGTDAMAAALASIDAAATSIGFPIRNMHTISECGHTGDILAAIHAVAAFLESIDRRGLTAEDLRAGHVRLDDARPLTSE
ncbi:MAG: M20/M25/M40 family metallo-hydrolase [Planctomycetes bacterium]|nr:M20/M25/M40 family metallo-hydrolase [Planctomycetota bacterium]